jgi:hypothetical protein
MSIPPIATVVETPEFIRRAEKLMTDDEREELLDYLARNPKAGNIVAVAGGIRKLRWRLRGRGKRGGARVIYFFQSLAFPLFVLGVYAKNEQVDLTQEDRNILRQRTKVLIETYRRKP